MALEGKWNHDIIFPVGVAATAGTLFVVMFLFTKRMIKLQKIIDAHNQIEAAVGYDPGEHVRRKRKKTLHRTLHVLKVKKMQDLHEMELNHHKSIENLKARSNSMHVDHSALHKAVAQLESLKAPTKRDSTKMQKIEKEGNIAYATSGQAQVCKEPVQTMSPAALAALQGTEDRLWDHSPLDLHEVHVRDGHEYHHCETSSAGHSLPKSMGHAAPRPCRTHSSTEEYHKKTKQDLWHEAHSLVHIDEHCGLPVSTGHAPSKAHPRFGSPTGLPERKHKKLHEGNCDSPKHQDGDQHYHRRHKHDNGDSPKNHSGRNSPKHHSPKDNHHSPKDLQSNAQNGDSPKNGRNHSTKDHQHRKYENGDMDPSSSMSPRHHKHHHHHKDRGA